MQKKLTLNDMAVKTGISKRMISAYESGESDITLSKLQKIATVLEVNIYDIIGELPQVNYNRENKTLNVVQEPPPAYRDKLIERMEDEIEFLRAQLDNGYAKKRKAN